MAHTFEGIEPFPTQLPPGELPVEKVKIRDEVSGYELISDLEYGDERDIGFSEMELEFMRQCFDLARPGRPVFNITFFWS